MTARRKRGAAAAPAAPEPAAADAGPSVDAELAWLDRELADIADDVEVSLSAAALRALTRRAAA